jgi:hypothetical protein
MVFLLMLIVINKMLVSSQIDVFLVIRDLSNQSYVLNKMLDNLVN